MEDGQTDPAITYLIIGLLFIIPGLIIGAFIYLKTKATEPPQWLLSLYACLAFVQSIAWINFASNSIVDLLKLFGFITGLP